MPCPENELLRGRPVRESASEYAEMALPNDANPLGNLLGGKVMHLVDMAGALAAMRHARCQVVTASIDSMRFLCPVHKGQVVIVKSSGNRAFTTSMEVGVKGLTEDLTTGERRHTSSAYVTFVAIDAEGRPVRVPPVIPETDDEKRRYQEACERRARRLEISQRGSSRL